MTRPPCEDQPDLWFDEDTEVEAKARCSSCPFKAECLQRALAFEASEKYRWGVWGGLTALERADL